MRKLTLSILSIVLSILLIGACSTNKPTQQLTEENLEAVSNIYEFPNMPDPLNEQAYKGGKIMFPNSIFAKPTTFALDSGYSDVYGDGTVHGVLMQSVNNASGSPTRIFAYYGLPAAATASNLVPGIVILHGGGGTAAALSVKQWNDNGYAAIAMAYQGDIPAVGEFTAGAAREDLGFGTPKNLGNGGFENSDGKPEDQFLYHASAASIVSNSFLRSLPFVDTTKIGITGSSWGGHITSIVLGYDNRYAFAITVFGTLNVTDSFAVFGKNYRKYPLAQYWDDTTAFKQSSTPILLINGNNDSYFSLDATTKTSNDAKFGIKSVINGLQHGQARPLESLKFANSVVNSGEKLIKITTSPVFGDRLLKYILPSGNSIRSIILYESESPNPLYATVSSPPAHADTIWTATAVGSRNRDDRNNLAIIELKPTTQMFYVEIEDKDGCIVSSDLARK